MHHIPQMLRTNPSRPLIEGDALAACIEACFDCVQSCIACSDACLGEDDPKMLSRCIRQNQDCADICGATGSTLSRNHEPDVEVLRRLVETCALACERCAEECERHQDMHEHCRVCAAVCRRCAQACAEALSRLQSAAAAARSPHH